MSLTTRLLLAPVLWLACACMPAAAQLPVEGDPRADAAGIVTSRAITVAGHEFSKHFIAAWRDKPDSERYTVAIHERPSARWGSQIWIEFAHRRVFQTQLPPARAALRARAEEAAEATLQAVMQADAQSRLIDDADLARDEF